MLLDIQVRPATPPMGGFLRLMQICSIYMGSSIVAPSIEALAAYFGVSTVVSTLTLTLFVVGYGVGPM